MSLNIVELKKIQIKKNQNKFKKKMNKKIQTKIKNFLNPLNNLK